MKKVFIPSIKLLIVLGCAMAFSSCKKFVESQVPKTDLVNAVVFSDDKTATSALLSIYSRMMTDGMASGSYSSLSLIAGLSSDELIGYSTELQFFYQNSILPSNSSLAFGLWQQPYEFIYTANSILEGVKASNGLSSAVKSQLTGEALFVRSFVYFYLVNLYGDVPFYTSTDYKTNSISSRTPANSIMDQIIVDLEEAKKLVSDNYIGMGRTRPNKSTVSALLARVYLFGKNWEKAAATASTIIENNATYDLEMDIDQVFLSTSKESIWQLMPVLPGVNTTEANLFILTDQPSYISLSPGLVNNFQEGDLRKFHWVDSITANGSVFYYPKKYKVLSGVTDVTEYEMVFRLSEQLLIRAEANIYLNKLDEAKNDINLIRKRAGLANTTANVQADLLQAVADERRFELFTEWGHRWLDLKRTDKATAVLGAIADKSWEPTDVFYPIPQAEISANPAIKQNDGYK